MENRSNLVEIKKNQTGYGLLIENDGFISMKEGDNRKLYESLQTNENGWHCPNPFIVSAVFQKFGIENANGRIYPEAELKREVEKYQTNIRESRAYGECNHPSESTIDLSRICMNIIELHWEGHTLVGKMEILTSEGFRKQGIISCQGDMIANHLLNGLKIGVSSRGVGDVENKFGVMYVSNYQLICWDVVSDPSTNNAWITMTDDELKPYLESKNYNNKQMLNSLSNYNQWLGLKD